MDGRSLEDALHATEAAWLDGRDSDFTTHRAIAATLLAAIAPDTPGLNANAARIDPDTVAPAAALAHTHVGELWDRVLCDEERRDLALAAALLDEPALAPMLPVALGLVVERMLVQRLMIIVRDRIKVRGLTLETDASPDSHEAKAADFLMGQTPLTLGALVGIFQKAVLLGDRDGGPALSPLATYLRALPQADLLYPDDSARLKRRFDALDKLIGLRNRAVHANGEPGSGLDAQAAAQESWAIVMDHAPGDPDAFITYFAGALDAAA